MKWNLKRNYIGAYIDKYMEMWQYNGIKYEEDRDDGDKWDINGGAKMMTIEEIRRKKKQLGYSNEMLARLSGVPLGTVQKVMAGVTKNPRAKTLAALSEAVAAGTNREPYISRGSEWSGVGDHAMFVREVAASYGKPNRVYTIEDIEALPDTVHAELIDGQIYFMAPPSRTHQKIAGEMHLIVANYIRARGGSCEVYIPPFGVYLTEDGLNYLEPDLTVVCDLDKLDEKGCHGAPDWVVEVISPSSEKKDSILKAGKYSEAGVRELWLIFPKKRVVITYRFENDSSECVTIYSFDDEIPCGIYPNLTVDLSAF